MTRLSRIQRHSAGANGSGTEKSDPKLKDFVKEYVTWGAGPRAGQYLILGVAVGSIAALAFNFTASRHLVFRER